MKRITLNLLMFGFIFSIHSFAQTCKEEYNTEKELLTEKRTRLIEGTDLIKSEIDSLRSFLPELEQKLNIGYSELFTLKYGEKIGGRVLNKKIWKGMTDEMVKDGWGKPDHIDKNVEQWGVFTHWYYGDIIFFFRDGKLTDWQEGPEE